MSRGREKETMEMENLNRIEMKMKKRFVKASYLILTNKDITDGEYRTYLVIMSHKIGNNKAFPSIPTIAGIRGRSERAISTHIAGLRRKKCISYKRMGFSGPNTYDFIEEENCVNGDSIQEENCHSKVKEITLLCREELPPNKINVNETLLNKEIKNKDDGFEDFREKVTELGIKK